MFALLDASGVSPGIVGAIRFSSLSGATGSNDRRHVAAADIHASAAVAWVPLQVSHDQQGAVRWI